MKQLIFRLLLIAAIFGIVVWACQDELSTPGSTSRETEISDARNWYEVSQSNPLDLKSGNVSFNVICVPNWDQAYRRNNKKYKTVEVPLNTLGRFTFMNSETHEHFKATNDKRVKQSMTRLVIRTEKKTNERVAFLMTIIPSLEYLGKTNYKPFHNTYINRDKDFDGYIIYHSLEGVFENGWKYEDGIITHSVKDANIDAPFKLKSGYYDCTTYEYWVTVEQCTDWYTSTEWGDEYTGTTCEYYDELRDSWTECVYVEDPNDPDPDDDGGYVPPDPDPCTCTNTCPYCGGCLDDTMLKSASTTSCPACTCPSIPAPNNPIPSITEYLDCFNANMPATVTIYVDQPIANSSATYSYTVGHAFIGISQSGNTSILGFYPIDFSKPTKKSDQSVLGDDSNHSFDVSISKAVSSSELAAILTYVKDYPQTYHLDDFNCTDFAIAIGSLAGMSLQDTQGTWPGGGGSNPGNLGQDIRNMTLSSDMTRDTAGGTSPSNVKNCQ